MQAEGIGGELRAGYAVAARLDAWRLVPYDQRHVVHGKLRHPDPYLMQQRPLTLILRVGAFTWTWENVVLEGGGILIEGAPVEGVKVLHGT